MNGVAAFFVAVKEQPLGTSLLIADTKPTESREALSDDAKRRHSRRTEERTTHRHISIDCGGVVDLVLPSRRPEYQATHSRIALF